MPARLKNRKGCSECAHCRAWKANKAFVRTTKANGGKLKQFLTCNHCSRAYRTTGYINEDDFHKKYRGRDHDDSDPEDDDGQPPPPKKHDQGGGPGQGGAGQGIAVA